MSNNIPKGLQREFDSVENLINQATDHAMVLVENEARKVLRSKNAATSFCMGMGTAAFYDKDNTPLDDDRLCFKNFYSVLHEFNDRLHLTGNPVRIDSADADIKYNW